jgi:hypothetical protein
VEKKMGTNLIERRYFIKKVLTGIAFLSLDWQIFPKGFGNVLGENEYDAIIGSD